jgi:hypothetical protein
MPYVNNDNNVEDFSKVCGFLFNNLKSLPFRGFKKSTLVRLNRACFVPIFVLQLAMCCHIFKLENRTSGQY